MKYWMIPITSALLLCASSQAFSKNTYSTQNCTAWFNKVDRNNDGSIGASENADGYLARVTLGNETESSSGAFIMSRAFFVAECKIGSLGKPEL
jgi:hypothetical protein